MKVKTYQALVELSPETSSYVKSTYTGLYAIAAINSFVIVPVGSERVVGIVTALDMAEEPEASLQNRQMLVIPRSRRMMWISMIGTITQHGTEKVFDMGSGATLNLIIRFGAQTKTISMSSLGKQFLAEQATAGQA